MTITGNDLPAGHAEILDFARRWYPYGGGTAEDILVEFGIGEREYFRRLSGILDDDAVVDLDRPTFAAMKQVATDRLATQQQA
ncbi:uncharacterized protein DUF3263 [Williamsia limnetica]|uniref:Uncharacterized protein DUF3263 n=1 Tax=Williamsia limnetica TaxID=882452 RepID=A0A318RP98_WILLI|nr:DUF3263 domain-containing protein [Williamsia limnetica]PYE17988.1 uncharacterized protein DUF3263 [Williamsia limnetica]